MNKAHKAYLDVLRHFVAGAAGGDGIDVEALAVTANGTYTAEDGKAYSPVNVNVRPNLTSMTVTEHENGTSVYRASDIGYDGYSSLRVNVDVPAPAVDASALSVTANGIYTPEAGKYYNSVTVDVPEPEVIANELLCTKNGEYVPESGTYYSKVTVDVPTEGGGGDPTLVLPDKEEYIYFDHFDSEYYTFDQFLQNWEQGIMESVQAVNSGQQSVSEGDKVCINGLMFNGDDSYITFAIWGVVNYVHGGGRLVIGFDMNKVNLSYLDKGCTLRMKRQMIEESQTYTNEDGTYTIILETPYPS